MGLKIIQSHLNFTSTNLHCTVDVDILQARSRVPKATTLTKRRAMSSRVRVNIVP